MRTLLVALAIAGCSRAPTAATPANKAPAADYQRTADDVLGFLPAQADVVAGVDMVALRSSALWSKFQPQVEAIGREFEKLGGQCGANPINTLERVTLAVKLVPSGNMTGVVVAHGIDTSRAIDCIAEQTRKNGGTAKVDRGVVIATYPDRPDAQMAATTVGAKTLVIQLDPTVSNDSIAAVLASGTPLRKSGSFMTLFERRERGASVWGMANGNAPLFNELAQMGMRPKSIDGTLTVTDRFTFAVRLAMPSAAEATRVVSEVDKIKGPASTMVERFDARADGANVTMDVVITEAQLRSLVGMLGGMMGP